MVQVAQIVNVVQVVRVVQVIKFVNLYDLHGLNNQMIEKKNLRCHACDTLTHLHRKVGQYSS